MIIYNSLHNDEKITKKIKKKILLNWVKIFISRKSEQQRPGSARFSRCICILCLNHL